MSSSWSNKKEQLSYAQKFAIMDKEAAATFIAALIIACFFWGSIYLFAPSNYFILGFPLWFVLSCIGGYVLSIIAVLIIVKCFFKNFSLDD